MPIHTCMVYRTRCQDNVIVDDSGHSNNLCVVTLCRTIGVCLIVTDDSCYYCLFYLVRFVYVCNKTTELENHVHIELNNKIIEPRLLS